MEARTEGVTTRTAKLIAHPATIDAPVVAVKVHFERRGQTLWLLYVVEGDVEAIHWPPQAAPVRRDDLWMQTCFEAFVQTDNGYREYNLAPSGEWASYRFGGYREGMMPAPETVVVAGLDRAPHRIALEGTIMLPAGARGLGLSAVVEDRDGARSYWALSHPGEAPDFHHPGSFALTLTEPA